MKREVFLQSFGHIADAPGGVDKLRTLVLSLAVRGALSSHDPAEAGSKVVERIAEQERAGVAGAAGAIRGAEPVAADEMPYSLPTGWAWAHLRDVLLKLTDGTHHSPQNGPIGDHPYISAKNVKDGYMLLDDLTFVSSADHEGIWARCDPRPGDVLFVKDGATTGNAALVELDVPFSMLSSVAQLRPAPGLNARYLLIAMRSPGIRRALRSGMAGSAITRTTLAKLGKVLLPIPPSAEQARVVNQVDALMALCDDLEGQQALRTEARTALAASLLSQLAEAESGDALNASVRLLAENLGLVLSAGDGDLDILNLCRQTILHLAVRGRLVSQDPCDEPASAAIARAKRNRPDWIEPTAPSKYSHKLAGYPLGEVPLPASWEYACLGEVLQLVNGRAYKRSEWKSAGTPVIRIQNLNGGQDYYFSDLELRAHNYCDSGDLLFAWSASFGPYIWAGGRAIFHYHIWKIATSPAITKMYAYYLLQAMTAAVKSASHGLAMLHMTKETMEGLLCPIPPVREQHRIVERVTELLALCDELEAQLVAARDLRGAVAASVVAHAAG